MLNELIEKISAQTGLPPATVQPVLGAGLAHLGDILPAPIAHQIAIMMGIHPDDGTVAAGTAAAPAAQGSGLGGVLEGLAGSMMSGGGGAQGQFGGAGALASVAESLLGSLLAGRR